MLKTITQAKREIRSIINQVGGYTRVKDIINGSEGPIFRYNRFSGDDATDTIDQIGYELTAIQKRYYDFVMKQRAKWYSKARPKHRADVDG